MSKVCKFNGEGTSKLRQKIFRFCVRQHLFAMHNSGFCLFVVTLMHVVIWPMLVLNIRYSRITTDKYPHSYDILLLWSTCCVKMKIYIKQSQDWAVAGSALWKVSTTMWWNNVFWTQLRFETPRDESCHEMLIPSYYTKSFVRCELWLWERSEKSLSFWLGISWGDEDEGIVGC